MPLPEIASYDVGETLKFAEAGRQRRTLADVGRLAATGDYRGAQAAAFGGGETELGLKLKQMGDADREKLVDDAASWAYAADTPEKWEAGRAMWNARGFDIGPYQSRQGLISQALSVKDRIAQANADRTYKLEQERLADAKASRNTQTVTIGTYTYERQPDGSWKQVVDAPKPPPSYGFTNMPGVGLVRTDPQAGTTSTVIPEPESERPQPTPYTDLAKIESDYKRGLLNDEQYAEAKKSLNAPNPASVANVNSIRTQFEAQPGTRRYRVAAPTVQSMIASVDSPTAMSDLDFIYGAAKVFDPDSAVREGEMTLVQAQQSLPAQFQGLVEKLAKGGAALGPQARRDLANAVINRVSQYHKQAEGEAAFYTGIAERNKINVQDVVRPLEPLPTWPAGSPHAVTPAPGAGGGGDVPPVRITGDADFERLPSGTKFIGPDGLLRVKP